MRRRGYPAAGIRDFLGRIGIAKTDSLVDIQLLEHCIREELNTHANRYMAVINPVKLVIENWPEGKIEWLEAVNNPEDPSAGIRKIPFSSTLYIDRDDFREVPPPKYYRLYPGNQVRLRYGYIVTCTGFEKNPTSGEIEKIRCVYDPNTRGGDAPDNRKVKGTIQWVCAIHAIPIEARLYDHLFEAERPMEVPEGKTFFDNLSDHSLTIESRAVAEPAVVEIEKGQTVQFERIGYFCKDPESTSSLAVFNRTVTLRDTWAKIEKKFQEKPH